MRYRLLTYLAATISVIIPAGVRAETVEQRHARDVAAKFFNAAHGRYLAEPKMVYNGRKLTSGRLFNPFYIYNSPVGGYVIVSAENKAFPILGYNLTASFDPNHLSDAETAVLRNYAHDIEMIRYDSRIPYDAIEAWSNIPEYIDNLLRAETRSADIVLSKKEQQSELESIAWAENSIDLWSDLYSPDQWTSMVGEELEGGGNLAIGYEHGDDIIAAIVYGNQGDYFLLDTEGKSDSRWLLFATEYMSQGKVGAFRNPLGVDDFAPAHEAPFSFYEDFISQTRAEEQTRLQALEDALIVKEPVVRHHGSGFYTVDLPERAVLARVYNIGGALTRQYKYDGLVSPHINLIGEPSGFYFAVIYTDSGNRYGVKLLR